MDIFEAYGTIFSQIVMALCLLIFLYYFLKTIRGTHSLFFWLWTALLIMNIIYFLISGSISDPQHFQMMKKTSFASLSFFPFYYFARQDLLKAKHLLWFLALILPIAIMQFLSNFDKITSLDLASGATLNVGYFFVGLIPFVFLIRNRILSIAIMLVLLFFIINSAKRGAIISGGIGLLLFIYYQMRTIEKGKRIRGYLMIGIGVIIMGYFLYDIYMSQEYLIRRMEKMAEGDSSGRDSIYTNIFNAWYYSESPFRLLFGFGFASSLRLSGSGLLAHNDWLELLSNTGLTGVLIYLSLFVSGFKRVFNKRWTSNKRILLLCVMLIWFFITLVSMGYTNTDTFMRASMLGYLFGSYSTTLR